MIDWDFEEIKKLISITRKFLVPALISCISVYHYEQILKIIMEDKVLLSDILNDIIYYTFNGVNARYKVLIVDE